MERFRDIGKGREVGTERNSLKDRERETLRPRDTSRQKQRRCSIVETQRHRKTNRCSGESGYSAERDSKARKGPKAQVQRDTQRQREREKERVVQET